MSDAGVFGGLVGPHLARVVWEEDVSVDHIVRVGGLRDKHRQKPPPAHVSKSSGWRVRSERRVDLQRCYLSKLIRQKAAGLKLTGRYNQSYALIFYIFFNKTVESDQH